MPRGVYGDLISTRAGHPDIPHRCRDDAIVGKHHLVVLIHDHQRKRYGLLFGIVDVDRERDLLDDDRLHGHEGTGFRAHR